jgi:hypothetical protein
MVFRGTVPNVRCGRISGFDCDEIVSADDEACSLGHVLPTRLAPGLPPGLSSGPGPKRAGRLYEAQVEHVSVASADEVLSRLARRPNELVVSRRACQQLAEHHGVEEDLARAELRSLVKRAAEAGHVDESHGGYWQLDFKGFSVRMDPAARVIVSYATRHYERTPSEVLDGKESRFRQNRHSRYVAVGPHLPLDELQTLVASAPVISERLATSWAKRRGCSPEEATSELVALVAADATNGVWEKAGECWMLDGSDQRWRIAPDEPRVIATWPTNLDH